MPINSFAKRLTQLRIEKGLKREDVAKKLNCSVSAVGNYENGNRTPDFDGLIMLADLFDTTTDYLLGKSNVKTLDTGLIAAHEYTGISPVALARLKVLEKEEPGQGVSLLSDFINDSNFIEIITNILDYEVHAERTYKLYQELYTKHVNTGVPFTKDEIKTLKKARFVDNMSLGAALAGFNDFVIFHNKHRRNADCKIVDDMIEFQKLHPEIEDNYFGGNKNNGND